MKDILTRIREHSYLIEDCSYEAMLWVLKEQYHKYTKTGEKPTARKIIPPDDKPLDISTCSKNSQDLFIQPNSTDSRLRFTNQE